MAESLKIEFLQNFFNNDKFNQYLKLYSKKIISLRDPRYEEYHKFINIIKESNLSVEYDDEYNEKYNYHVVNSFFIINHEIIYINFL